MQVEERRNDDQRIMRSSLNEIIAKMFAIRIEMAKYIQTHPNWMENDLMIAVWRTYTEQLNSYARLAVFLMEKITSLVSDVEFATIADTFGFTGDQASAIHYFETAIKKAENRNYQVQHRRAYAQYLFNMGNVGLGREEFDRALKLFPESDDFAKAQNGATYKFWAISEARAQNKKMSENYFAYSEDIYNSISRNEIKAPLLKDLAQIRAQVQELKPNTSSITNLDATSVGAPLAAVTEEGRIASN